MKRRIPHIANYQAILLFTLASILATTTKVHTQTDESARDIQRIIANLQTPLLQGYQQSVSGETIGYHSASEYAKDALLVRTLDGNGEIKWLTENVPMTIQDSSETFGWMAGLSGSKGVHRFDLFIDDRLTLSFTSRSDTSQKNLAYEGKRGERLTFIVTKVDQFGDLFGYMFLQMSAKLVRPGKSLAVKVVGAAEGKIGRAHV
jgi:alpha-mannosidase